MLVLSALLLVAAEPNTPTDADIRQTLLSITAFDIRASLMDPPSALFRDVYFRSTVGVNGRTHWGICGYINSKDSNGAYIGFRSFMSSSSFRGGVKVRIEGGSERLPGISCTRANGTWLLDYDLSKQLSELVTAP